MATTCEQCGRGPMSAQSRSHSNIATKRKQHINLQRLRANGRRISVCTRCMKSSHVAR
ncbi:MAG: 50S ribosomal protein L28 [Candidatus Kerfeldbacteria bacterium]|nr:50S ribosomal protein L28 [Candidatus Kerfeldbacteria bacterium]